MNVTLEQSVTEYIHLWNESTRARNCQISMEQIHDLFQQTERNCISARKDNLAPHEHMHTNHS